MGLIAWLKGFDRGLCYLGLVAELCTLLNLYGMLSSNFVVQYSTNLAGTNWMSLLSLTNLPSSPHLFLDPAGDGEPARFYRAFMR
jgi:hypothetical protein